MNRGFNNVTVVDDRGHKNHSAQPPTDYIFPEEITMQAFSIKSYEPPETKSRSPFTKQAVPTKKKFTLPVLCRSQRRTSPAEASASPRTLQSDAVMDSRFQKETEHPHRDRTEKRTSPWHSSHAMPGVEILSDLEKMNVADDDSTINSDLLAAEMDDKHTSKKAMKKDNKKLNRALRRTVKFLECERAHKLSLQERVDTLSILVDQLQKSKDNEQSLNHLNVHTDHSLELKKQIVECQKQLKEERSKNQKLHEDAEALKKENIKMQEKMRVLMFQHMPNASVQFDDIGACNANVEETDDLIADYELGMELGSGHYGKVCIGIYLSNKKRYAVKVINKARINRFKDLQQVAMEVHVLKKYPHPNIVRLEEVIHAPLNLYLVTELCVMDLHKFHNDIGLSEFGAKHVILGILKPLYHLHSHGIAHLDLKPENVLISANAHMNNITHNDIRLCDFGLVTMASTPEQSKDIIRKGYACGTPGFFAPEMILKNAFEGRQADVWSLGCIILELTLGFTKEWIDSYDQIDSSPASFKRGLQKCLDEIAPENYPRHRKLLDIIHSCLSIDSMRRITSKDALIHAWLEDAIMNDEEDGRQDVPADSVSIHQKKDGYSIMC